MQMLFSWSARRDFTSMWGRVSLRNVNISTTNSLHYYSAKIACPF